VSVLALGCVPGFSPVLDTRDRLGGNVGGACDEFEDSQGNVLGRLMFLRVVVPAYLGCPG